VYNYKKSDQELANLIQAGSSLIREIVYEIIDKSVSKLEEKNT
jgi:hypothetical protein